LAHLHVEDLAELVGVGLEEVAASAEKGLVLCSCPDHPGVCEHAVREKFLNQMNFCASATSPPL